MNEKKLVLLSLAIFGLLMIIFPASHSMAAEINGVNIYSTDSDFDEVIFGLESAVIDRGYKIDYKGYISRMMERTAQDFGGDKSVYKNAQFMTFCSVSLTRAMVKADPKNLAFCPYIIFIYELRDKPGQTFIGYRRPITSGSPESIKAVSAVDKLLDSIVRKAVE